MRKAARAKAIIESAVPIPLENIEDSSPLHEETFDIGPVSNPEDTPEEPEPLNEDKLAEIRAFKCKLNAWRSPSLASSVTSMVSAQWRQHRRDRGAI